ncbi:MAG TPA: hypothetical protein VFZ08_10245 [Terriglobia bacterium]|nr:hypothetical protein [Terriglobia bacterium]
MTTGVGFRCKDGVILASDSQYTGTWKMRGPKIFDITAPCATGCVAGAGTVSLIRKATSIIGGELAQRQGITVKEAVAVVEDCIKTIREKYIHSHRGPDDQRPYLELLMGISTRNFVELIKTEDYVADTVDRYAVVGTGGPLVQYIVESLGGAQGILEQAKIVSIYALHQAKEYDPWSGKETCVKILRADQTAELIGDEEIRNAESYFDDLFLATQTLIVTSAIPEDFSDEDVISYSDFKRVVRKFRESERARREKAERRKEVMQKWSQRHKTSPAC